MSLLIYLFSSNCNVYIRFLRERKNKSQISFASRNVSGNLAPNVSGQRTTETAVSIAEPPNYRAVSEPCCEP